MSRFWRSSDGAWGWGDVPPWDDEWVEVPEDEVPDEETRVREMARWSIARAARDAREAWAAMGRPDARVLRRAGVQVLADDEPDEMVAGASIRALADGKES